MALSDVSSGPSSGLHLWQDITKERPCSGPAGLSAKMKRNENADPLFRNTKNFKMEAAELSAKCAAQVTRRQSPPRHVLHVASQSGGKPADGINVNPAVTVSQPGFSTLKFIFLPSSLVSAGEKIHSIDFLMSIGIHGFPS